MFFLTTDEMLNAMGSARLEIMDERDEDSEIEKSPKKTASQQKVWTGYLLISKVLFYIQFAG